MPSLRVPVTVTVVQLSVAVGDVRLTFAREQLRASAARSIVVGQVLSGGWLSVTVTLKVHVAWFPAASVAVAVTGVVPTGKVDPDGGTVTTVTVTQVSVAVTL